MPTSINDIEVQTVLDQARAGQGTLFPSPGDWRDHWIYFLMLDRFNNSAAPPKNSPYNAEFDKFQGGTYNGVRQQLKYLQTAGGASTPGAVVDKPAGSITIHEIDGTATSGPARTLPVDLQAAEIQILGR